MKKARVTAARAVVTAMRVVCDKEGEGGMAMAMAMATRVAVERTMMVTKRAMETAIKVAGT
jgi:hypothetical protein